MYHSIDISEPFSFKTGACRHCAASEQPILAPMRTTPDYWRFVRYSPLEQDSLGATGIAGIVFPGR